MGKMLKLKKMISNETLSNYGLKKIAVFFIENRHFSPDEKRRAKKCVNKKLTEPADFHPSQSHGKIEKCSYQKERIRTFN